MVGAASEVGRFGMSSALTSHPPAGPLTDRAEVIRRGTERAIETTLANENMMIGAQGVVALEAMENLRDASLRLGHGGMFWRTTSHPLLYLSSAQVQVECTLGERTRRVFEQWPTKRCVWLVARLRELPLDLGNVDVKLGKSVTLCLAALSFCVRRDYNIGIQSITNS